jgi:hypothetical protein
MRRGGWIPAVVALVLASPAPLMVAPVPLVVAIAVRPAVAQEARGPLERATELYESARFSEAIDVLNDAIREGRVTGDDVNAARELLARCLAKAGRRLEAKEAWKSVLRSNPIYLPDATRIPPDEIESFHDAKREFDAELLEAGRRKPASIGGIFGVGQAVNQDLADLASSAGVAAADDFESNPEFGYSVRFPLRPRWSIDFELSRLRATTQDELPETRNAHAEYLATAIPVVASIYYQVNGHPKLRISGFAGLGIFPAEAKLLFDQTLVSGRLIPTQVVGEATGYYLHAGVETEYLVAPRYAVSVRLLGRRASSGDLDWPRDNFEIYESFPASVLGKRSVDFSGVAAHVGVRAYIGY